MILKGEIEKILGFKEKNRINVGFRTPYAGFTPFTTPWDIHPKLKSTLKN